MAEQPLPPTASSPRGPGPIIRTGSSSFAAPPGMQHMGAGLALGSGARTSVAVGSMCHGVMSGGVVPLASVAMHPSLPLAAMVDQEGAYG